MAVTRSVFFVVIAFVLFLLAALVAGGVISINSATHVWEWMTAGGLASYMLSILIP